MFVPVRSTKFWKAYYIKMWVCAYMFCVAENTGWFQFVKTWPLSLLFWPSACWTQQIDCNVAKKKSEKGKKKFGVCSLSGWHTLSFNKTAACLQPVRSSSSSSCHLLVFLALFWCSRTNDHLGKMCWEQNGWNGGKKVLHLFNRHETFRVQPNGKNLVKTVKQVGG